MSTSSSSRLRALSLSMLLGIGCAIGSSAWQGGEQTAWAGPAQLNPDNLREGSELVALQDVKLRQATIAKGSRVKVREITRRDGQLVALSLELKDGHVLRGVAYHVVAQSFRLASPS